jgi:general secretion pathway protein E
VLSTLHTNDAISSVTRLLDMGLEDYLLTSTLIAILAQRLVRRLCRHCKQPYPADAELVSQLGLRRFQPEGQITLYQAKGCPECGNIGYQGRSMIVELLVFSDTLRASILKGIDAIALRELAINEGMMMLYEDGLQKALAGVTSLEEVIRVTSEK